MGIRFRQRASSSQGHVDEEDASSPTIIEESASFQENRQTYVPRTLLEVQGYHVQEQTSPPRTYPQGKEHQTTNQDVRGPGRCPTTEDPRSPNPTNRPSRRQDQGRS